jgi:hypothetical protein
MNDTFPGNVWMKKSGGFAQNGFIGLKKWASTTGLNDTIKNLQVLHFSKRTRKGNDVNILMKEVSIDSMNLTKERLIFLQE